MYELYLLPIDRKDGNEKNQINGLFTTTAPKRCQRSHKTDRLLLWLSVVTGQELLTEDELNQWLKEAARIYFNARGSITAGLRECANALNARFLERGKQGRTGAKLNMAVLRDEDIYFGHAGAVYTFLLQDNQMTPFFNTASHAQVLGYVDQVHPQFFQSHLSVGDVLLFSPAPAQGWNRQTLTFEKRPSLQSVRRRLLSNTQGNFESLVLQIQEGQKGEFHRMKLANAERSASAVETAAAPLPASAKPKRTSGLLRQETTAHPALSTEQTPKRQTPPPQNVDPQENPSAIDETIAVAEDKPVAKQALPNPNRGKSTGEPGPEAAVYIGRKGIRRQPEPAHLPVPGQEEPPAVPVVREKRPSLLERFPLPDMEESKRRFAAFWLKLRKIDPNEGVVVVSREDVIAEEPETRSTEPEASEKKTPVFNLPISPRIMLFVAIAVPLIVAAVAGTVYFQKGVMKQFTAYYDQAYLVTYQAMAERDTAIRKEKLLNAQQYLDEAEKYRRTDESSDLRAQIDAALDDAAGVVRLELFNALGSPLKREVSLTRILLNNDRDLFALDGPSGQVLHFNYDGNVYQLDTSFNCGGGTNMIIDIALLSPTNEYKADVLGIDASGTITYCTIGAPPIPQKLSTPVFGWVQVAGMVLEREDLYVLDAGTRALWSIYGEKQKFIDAEPFLFFSKDASLDLTRVKAMDVYADTIAFVQTNDKVMTCVIDAIDAGHRECFYLNPIDTEGNAIALNAVDWTNIHTLDYPPSYFLMDQNQKTLYQFSVQMKLNKSFRFYSTSGDVIPNEAITAYTVTDKQWVLIAYGNEIFMGQLR